MDEKPNIAKLTLSHDPTSFDCGNEALNGFIRRHALTGQRAQISQTYVAVIGQAIIGYHTLVVGSVNYEDAPERLAKGIPRYPIPAMLLARLAVDRHWQGKALGPPLSLTPCGGHFKLPILLVCVPCSSTPAAAVDMPYGLGQAAVGAVPAGLP